MKRTCVQCNKEFELPQSEINFYKSKNLHLPKRCKECRALNKGAKAMQSEAQTVVERPQVKATGKKTPIIFGVIFLILALAMFFGDKFPVEDNTTANVDTTYETNFEVQEESIEQTSGEYEEVETTVSRTSTRTFRKEEYLQEHYEKHGIDMGFDSAAEYLAAANKVLENEDVLHKIEAEDGDDVYYLEATNEFVIVSTDGYIRTYFYPEDGIDYFNRQ